MDKRPLGINLRFFKSFNWFRKDSTSVQVQLLTLEMWPIRFSNFYIAKYPTIFGGDERVHTVINGHSNTASPPEIQSLVCKRSLKPTIN